MPDLDALVAAITAMPPSAHAHLDDLMQIDTSVPMDDPRVARCPLGFIPYCVSLGLLKTWTITGTLLLPTRRYTEERLAPTLLGWAAWKRFVHTKDEGHCALPAWLER